MLLLRDTALFAHGWVGKLLVAAVLVAVPVAMVLTSVGGGRYGRYADDSWEALLMLVVLAGSYLALRRLVLTVLIGAVTVAVVSWAVPPRHKAIIVLSDIANDGSDLGGQLLADRK